MLMAFETYRSKERQQLLFDQKVTKLQTVGVHHYGLACDIVRNIGGHPSWKGDLSIIGRLARKHGLVWGGDWGRPDVTPSFVDPVHVQRCPVSRQKELFAGTWYPDDAYDPWSELYTVSRSMRRSRRKRAKALVGARARKSKRSDKPSSTRSSERAKVASKSSKSKTKARTKSTTKSPGKAKAKPRRTPHAKSRATTRATTTAKRRATHLTAR
jgi:hypothetical protein